MLQIVTTTRFLQHIPQKQDKVKRNSGHLGSDLSKMLVLGFNMPSLLCVEVCVASCQVSLLVLSLPWLKLYLSKWSLNFFLEFIISEILCWINTHITKAKTVWHTTKTQRHLVVLAWHTCLCTLHHHFTGWLVFIFSFLCVILFKYVRIFLYVPRGYGETG